MYYNFLHSDPYEHMEKNTKKRKENETSHTHTHNCILIKRKKKEKKTSSLQHHNLTLIYNILKARFEIKRPEVFLA